MTSLARLATCDERLRALWLAVVAERDCSIICGHRGEEDQNLALKHGFSKVAWPNSRHNRWPSTAVDVAPWYAERPHIRWDDRAGFLALADYALTVAAEMGIQVRWGGHWTRFPDLPHYELVDE